MENELIQEGHDIISTGFEGDAQQYESKLQSYLEKAEDIKKSDLAGYVAHRRVIIDLLEKVIQRQQGSKYVHESIIHKLIMPMRSDSKTVSPKGANLWLIDERLAFHDYFASDKPIKSYPIMGSEDLQRPDFCSLNFFDQPIVIAESTQLPPASIQIVEIKRPMRDDFKPGEDHDPLEKVLGYLKKIREGGVQTLSGRPIPKSPNIPGFCFVLADLTPTLIDRCGVVDLTRTADGQGYFGYNKHYQAYIEVISFDGLLKMAKERNRAFFDKLGLPAN